MRISHSKESYQIPNQIKQGLLTLLGIQGAH